MVRVTPVAEALEATLAQMKFFSYTTLISQANKLRQENHEYPITSKTDNL
jgi:hypothetical protein